MDQENVIVEIDLGKVKPTLEFLSALASTAVEGGIGYWARCTHYKERETHEDACARLRIDPETPKDEVVTHKRDLPFPEISLVPAEDPDEFQETVVTSETMCTGLARALAKPESMGNHRAARIRQAIIEDDAGYLDAEDADVILQYALFDKLVYA